MYLHYYFSHKCHILLYSSILLCIYSPVLCGKKISCLFDPPKIEIPLGSVKDIKYYLFEPQTKVALNGTVSQVLYNITSQDLTSNPIIKNRRIARILKTNNETYLKIKSVFLGKTILTLRVKLKQGDLVKYYKCDPIQITVIRKENALIIAFRGLVLGFIVLNTFLFGCKIDSDAIQQLVKKPFAIILGAICQLVGMPLIAYGYGILLNLNPTNRFSLFLVGCCPGGGSSNLWTYMLGGDLLLSICMTFVNTLGTFASMPSWFALLGPRVFPPLIHTTASTTLITVTNERRVVKIPYVRIITSLLYGTLPPVLGMLLLKYRPTLAHKLARWVKPFTVCMIIVVVVIGIVANLYIFKVLETRNLLLAGLALPWTGFVLGYVACLAFNMTLRLLATTFPTLFAGRLKELFLESAPRPRSKISSTGSINALNTQTSAPSNLAVTYLKNGQTSRENGSVDLEVTKLHHHEAEGGLSPEHGRPTQNITSCIPGPARITVAIETGLQNAGIAMVLLWSVYPQPEADLAIAVPVACSMMTPLPLIAVYLIRLVWGYIKNRFFV